MSRVSLFPPVDLGEALLIAKTILEQNAGKPMRRLTIFHALGRSPESSTSRALITASSGYDLTEGGYTAEVIKLTERGQAIVGGNDPQARIDAIQGVPIFSEFFEHYRNATVPSTNAAVDFLKGHGLNEQNAKACLDVLLKCGEQVALIQEISGVKRVVSPDHALEKLSQTNGSVTNTNSRVAQTTPPSPDAKRTPAPRVTTANPIIPITMNIQIAIPSDATAEQYDKIFASIKKYLIQPNSNE